MPRRRFRWTRKTYRKAHHLARLLGRFGYFGSTPDIVERYHELWRQHPLYSDPLTVPLLSRPRFLGDDIPF